MKIVWMGCKPTIYSLLNIFSRNPTILIYGTAINNRISTFLLSVQSH